MASNRILGYNLAVKGVSTGVRTRFSVDVFGVGYDEQVGGFLFFFFPFFWDLLLLSWTLPTHLVDRSLYWYFLTGSKA